MNNASSMVHYQKNIFPINWMLAVAPSWSSYPRCVFPSDTKLSSIDTIWNALKPSLDRKTEPAVEISRYYIVENILRCRIVGQNLNWSYKSPAWAERTQGGSWRHNSYGSWSVRTWAVILNSALLIPLCSLGSCWGLVVRMFLTMPNDCSPACFDWRVDVLAVLTAQIS